MEEGGNFRFCGGDTAVMLLSVSTKIEDIFSNLKMKITGTH